MFFLYTQLSKQNQEIWTSLLTILNNINIVSLHFLTFKFIFYYSLNDFFNLN